MSMDPTKEREKGKGHRFSSNSSLKQMFDLENGIQGHCQCHDQKRLGLLHLIVMFLFPNIALLVLH